MHVNVLQFTAYQLSCKHTDKETNAYKPEFLNDDFHHNFPTDVDLKRCGRKP